MNLSEKKTRSSHIDGVSLTFLLLLIPLFLHLSWIGPGIGVFSSLIGALMLIGWKKPGESRQKGRVIEVTRSSIVIVVVILTAYSDTMSRNIAESVMEEAENSDSIYSVLPNYYNEIKLDGDNLSIAFLGTSVTRDGIDAGCIENYTADLGANAQIYNLAVPGDDIVLRLPEVGLIQSSGVEVIAIEISHNLIRNFLVGGKTSEINALKFNSRVLLYEPSFDHLTTLTASSEIEEWMEYENVEIIRQLNIIQYFSNLLEGELSDAISGTDPDSGNTPNWLMNAKGGGTKRSLSPEDTETLASRIKAVFVNDTDAEPYRTSWGEIPDYANRAEPTGVNRESLENFIDLMTGIGIQILLYTPPSHPAISEHAGYDWQNLSSMSSGLEDGNDAVHWVDMRTMENHNHYWVDDHHPSIYGKSGFCTTLSEGISDYFGKVNSQDLL